jgi:hypothetical protein
MDLNTSLIYPLSGETIFCPANQTTTYTTSGVGIVYLLGSYATFTSTINVSINGRTIGFTNRTWTNDKGTTNSSLEFPIQVNLLTPSIRNSVTSGSSTVQVNYANHPGAPTDRNGGAYLPVKKGDLFQFVTANNGEVIASFLYF